MGNYDELDSFYDKMTVLLTDYYQSGDNKTVFELAEALMDLEGLPIHCPPHHYLIPAVLLTACRQSEGDSLEELKCDLEEALSRSKNVLGGFCGLYGNCGAAVGVGIFMSIYTGTTPVSKKSWAITNRATATALMSISEIDGPRCCKRNTYLALYSARDFIKEHLGIDLKGAESIECKYHKKNKECKGKSCPYFPMMEG